ncbi:MAG: SH3 domain-containing protein, partial [Thermomicrobiales bacterium]
MGHRAGRRRTATRGHIFALCSLIVILLSLIQPALAVGREGTGPGTAVAQTPETTFDPTQPVAADPTVPDASEFQTTQETNEQVIVTGTVVFLVLDVNRLPIADGYKLCFFGLECANLLDGRATVDGVVAGESQYRIVRLDDESLLFNDVVQVGSINSSTPTEIVLPFAVAAGAPAEAVSSHNEPLIAPSANSSETLTVTSPALTPTAGITPTATATTTTSVTPTVTATATATASVTPPLTATTTASVTPTATATATKPATPTPTPGPGSGSVTGTNGAGLNCRATPSLSGTVITVLPEGAAIPYRGPAQDGWQPVTCASKAGFISTQYVVTTPVTPAPTVVATSTSTSTTTSTSTVTSTATVTPAPNSGKIIGTNGAGLNCRQSPSTSGVIITVIREGVIVPLRGPAQNGWQPVTCGGQDGYVYTAYLATISTTPTPPSTTTPTATPSGTITPTPTPAPGSESGVIAGTGGGGVNCRQGPDTSYPVITVVAEGARVSFRGVAANGWQPVTCAGQAGYIYVLYLTGTASPGQGEFWMDINLST